MHFALPPRKTSHPPPYAPRQSRFPGPRLRRLQTLALFALALLTTLYLLARFLPSSTTDRLTTTPSFLSTPPPGTPLVVIVTPLDRVSYDAVYLQKIKENRVKYAKAHDYTAFFPAVTDYDLAGAPSGWARIPAVRHAMTLHPHSTYFFHLDQHALIMNHSIKVEDYVMKPHRLESIMMRGQPIVPPESVIKTYPHLTADKVELVVTQDGEGLSQSSFILKQGEWARYFLDTWFDPLYRNYNFQKGETHALVRPYFLLRRSSFPTVKLTLSTGTPGAVALDHPLPPGHHPPTRHQLLLPRHPRAGSQLSLLRRRFRHQLLGL